MAMFTRSSLLKASHEELVEKCMALNEINKKLTDVEANSILVLSKFDSLAKKIEMVESSLAVSNKVNSLLREKIIELEKSTLHNSQYQRRECIELNSIPAKIDDMNLEQSVCDALSLTGISVKPIDLEATHRLRLESNVIVKFKSHKKRNEVFSNRKVLASKSKELLALNFNKSLFINHSLCRENQHLFYQSRMLKKAKIIYDTWFNNNSVNIKHHQHSNAIKVYHAADIEFLLKIDDLERYLESLKE